MHNSLKFDMQHDHVLKKLNFDPTPRGWRGGFSRQNICYHVAAFVIPFNLICNMTIFWKGLIFISAPPPKSTQGADHVAACVLFNMQHVLKSWILTFWPQHRNEGGGIIVWECCCIQFHLILIETWPCSGKVEIFSLGVCVGGGGGSACNNVSYHVAAWVHPFNLIHNKTIFRKSWIWTLSTYPISSGSGGGLQAKYLLPCCCNRDST